MPATHRPHSPHLRRPQPAAAADSGVASGRAPHELSCPPGLPDGSPPVRLAAGVRSSAGHSRLGRQPPRTLAWLPPPAWPRAGHCPSGRQSFRKHRTVNPLILPARYTFLYSSFLYSSFKAGLRAAAGGGRSRPAGPPSANLGSPMPGSNPAGSSSGEQLVSWSRFASDLPCPAGCSGPWSRRTGAPQASTTGGTGTPMLTKLLPGPDATYRNRAVEME
jgi:hypothetical protein